jgi:hypothetical protein
MCLFRILAIVTVALSAVLPAADTDLWPMRWRVCADYTAGYTFRYPYEYEPPHQYKTELSRGFTWQGADTTGAETVTITVNGKKITAIVNNGPAKGEIDVKAFSFKAAELPTGLDGSSLAEVGNRIAQDQRLGLKPADQALTWQSYDYYQKQPSRPFADAKWAAPGIEASIGESAGACGLVVKHGERWSGLICAGKLSAGDNRAILESFEILAQPKGAKEPRSWREAMGAQGKVLDADGQLVPAAPAKAVGWSRAWETETRHYHVTSHVSPRRLAEYGAVLEALYKVYTATYNPDAVPPYKLEVHIFNTQSDFMSAAAAKGFPVGSGVGGFFVPSLLSIFAFEDTRGAHFPPEAVVEKILAHECSHQFLHVTCNGSSHVPTWMNEGLAVYFESGDFAPGTHEFRLAPPHGRIGTLKSLYGQRKDTLWPLDNYLKHYGHISAEQYGEVYAMVHFWIFGAPGGLKHFKDYWQALKAGENGSDAFERVFMADLIKVHGSREKALAVWQRMLVDYVVHKLN